MSSTWKRRQRRLRALARYRWFLHRSHFAILNLLDLQRLHRILAAHRSRDPQLLRVIRREIIRKQSAAMDHGRGTIPVEMHSVTQCLRITKRTALKCAKCEAHWTSGTKRNTERKPQTFQAYRATAYRDAWPPEPHSIGNRTIDHGTGKDHLSIEQSPAHRAPDH